MLQGACPFDATGRHRTDENMSALEWGVSRTAGEPQATRARTLAGSRDQEFFPTWPFVHHQAALPDVRDAFMDPLRGEREFRSRMQPNFIQGPEPTEPSIGGVAPVLRIKAHPHFL